jgi:hypothetical protein
MQRRHSEPGVRTASPDDRRGRGIPYRRPRTTRHRSDPQAAPAAGRNPVAPAGGFSGPVPTATRVVAAPVCHSLGTGCDSKTSRVPAPSTASVTLEFRRRAGRAATVPATASMASSPSRRHHPVRRHRGDAACPDAVMRQEDAYFAALGALNARDRRPGAQDFAAGQRTAAIRGVAGAGGAAANRSPAQRGGDTTLTGIWTVVASTRAPAPSATTRRGRVTVVLRLTASARSRRARCGEPDYAAQTVPTGALLPANTSSRPEA